MRAASCALLLLLTLVDRAHVARADVVTAIKDNAQLSQLFSFASQYPRIVDTLTNLQTGTVLAPNDAAFGALLKAATAANIELDPATVETVLKYHVITEGSYLKADLSDGQELQTAADVPVTATFTDGKLGWKGVGSSAMDVREMKVGDVAVHIIDGVLLPVELLGPARASPPPNAPSPPVAPVLRASPPPNAPPPPVALVPGPAGGSSNSSGDGSGSNSGSSSSGSSSGGSSEGSSSGGTGTIIGAAVGGLVAVAVVAGAAFWMLRRRKLHRQHVHDEILTDKPASPAGDDFVVSTEPPTYAGDTNWQPTADAMTSQSAGLTGIGSISAATQSVPGTTSVETTIRQPASLQHSNGSDDILLALIQSQLPEASKLANSGGSGDSGMLASSQRTPSSGVDPRPWQFDFAELTIIKPVGCGSFGTVFLASWHQIQVAAKVLIDREALLGRSDTKDGSLASSLILPPSLASKLDEEASLMASLRHPNIVGFLGVCFLPPCMISEYCARGSLADVLAAGRQDATMAAELTWRCRLSMALDGALGMLYLHSRPVPICHRDLKSPNLLVDEHMRVKVADFNLSRLVQEGSRTSSAAVMNPVLWEILTWELPWTGAETENPWQVL